MISRLIQREHRTLLSNSWQTQASASFQTVQIEIDAALTLREVASRLAAMRLLPIALLAIAQLLPVALLLPIARLLPIALLLAVPAVPAIARLLPVDTLLRVRLHGDVGRTLSQHHKCSAGEAWCTTHLSMIPRPAVPHLSLGQLPGNHAASASTTHRFF